MSLNKCMIIGNLGRDPEMRYTPSGQAVTQFTVAINRNYRDAAGRVAGRDRVVPRRGLGPAGGARRGEPAQGQQGLRRRSHPDPPVGRSDGQKRYTTELVANHQHLERRERDEDAPVPRRPAPGREALDPPACRVRPAASGGAGRPPAAASDDFDDLPF